MLHACCEPCAEFHHAWRHCAASQAHRQHRGLLEMVRGLQLGEELAEFSVSLDSGWRSRGWRWAGSAYKRSLGCWTLQVYAPWWIYRSKGTCLASKNLTPRATMGHRSQVPSHASQMLVTRDIHHPVQVESELFQHLFLLGDDKIFYSLARVVLQTGQQLLLEKALQNETVANLCAREFWGRDVLQVLSQKYVALLAGCEVAPKFTWSQPHAQLQEHPIMEAFLRATGESSTYRGFSTSAEARKLALGYCDVRCRNGYCAFGKASGGGAESYCVIQKSPVAYLHSWREIKDIAEKSEAGAVMKRPNGKGPERIGAEIRPSVEGSERIKRADVLAAAVKVAVVEVGPAVEHAILDIVNQHRREMSSVQLGPNLK